MVARALVGKLVDALVRDWQKMARQLQFMLGSGRTAPGLYSYPIQCGGGRVMVHLRVHEDGSGMIFADAWDVVHLNPQATEIARMLLDGISEPQVVRVLESLHPEVPTADLRFDVVRIGATLRALKQPGEVCRTCRLDLPRTPVYGSRAKAPHRADLALTYSCNNRCGHCYNDPGRRGMPSLSRREWEKILGKLKGIGVPMVVFTGGEPTLHPELVRLVRRASRMGFVTGLNTNGRLLTQGLTRDLARAGLDAVQVTLASHRREVHDAAVGVPAFEETVAGIRACLDAGLHTLTNTTLCRNNWEDILETIEFVHGLGVKTVAMNAMICAGLGRCNEARLDETELAPALQLAQERARELGMRFLWYTPTRYCRLSPLALDLGPKTCSAAEYSICVEPNGDVLPCQSYYVPAGNLLQDDWEAIWDGELFRKLRLRREDPAGAGLPEECWRCEDLAVCGGGCPLNREREGSGAAVVCEKASC